MAKEPRGKQQDAAPAVQPVTEPVVQAESISARFTRDVISGFTSTIGAPQVSDYQKRLIQNYFIGIDRALAEAESKRNRDDRPPVCWQYVNTTALVVDVVDCARLGLDMSQDNHLYAIPYFNDKTKLYDVTLMIGYSGMEYVALKYAAEKPLSVTLQLVYENDSFRPIMRDAVNDKEAYQFEITNPFDRGKLIGGFGYIEYEDPRKNRLVMLSKAQMDKRKPERRSGNFWGKWDDEMYLKTLSRHVYSPKYIPRDPEKIDDSYQRMKIREARIAQMEANAEIAANANGEIVDVNPSAPALSSAAVTGLPESRGVVVELPVDRSTGELLDVSAAAPRDTGRAAPMDAAASPVMNVDAPPSGAGADDGEPDF